MGQAKNRGSLDERKAQAKEAFAALPLQEQRAERFRRLPAAEKRARYNAALANATAEVMRPFWEGAMRRKPNDNEISNP